MSRGDFGDDHYDGQNDEEPNNSSYNEHGNYVGRMHPDDDYGEQDEDYDEEEGYEEEYGDEVPEMNMTRAAERNKFADIMCSINQGRNTGDLNFSIKSLGDHA
eukprot:15339960-Ditylum_brightwellii.AAC.1